MKTAFGRVIVSIAILAWLAAGQAAVGQENSYPEVIPPGEPVSSAVPSDVAAQSTGEVTGPYTIEPVPEVVESSPCEECGQEAGGCWCNGDFNCCPPDWYLMQGTRIMHRSACRAMPLTLSYVGGVVTPALDARGIKFDVVAGYDATLGHYLGRDSSNRDQFLEFTYYGLNTWRETRDLRGIEATSTTGGVNYLVGTLYAGAASGGFDQTVTGFNRANRHDFAYESRFDNFELNVRLRPRKRQDRLVLNPNGRWRRECQPGCHYSWLFGVRGLSYDEAFDWLAEASTAEEADPSNVHNSSGQYRIRTHNDMVGFQVGVDAIFKQNLWEYGLRFKAAPMINFADQTSSITTEGAADDPFAQGEPDLNVRRYANRAKAAVYLEWGVVGKYYLQPNFNVFAAYDMAWLVGVAYAPDQIDYQTNAASRLTANGLLFLQGLQLGAEITW